MRLRAADIRDLQSRLLRALLGRREADLSRLPAGCVPVTRELTPSMAVGAGPGSGWPPSLTETGRLCQPCGHPWPGPLASRRCWGGGGPPGGERTASWCWWTGTRGPPCPVLAGKEQEEYRTRRAALLRRQARLEPFRRRPTVDGDGRRRGPFPGARW